MKWGHFSDYKAIYCKQPIIIFREETPLPEIVNETDIVEMPGDFFLNYTETPNGLFENYTDNSFDSDVNDNLIVGHLGKIFNLQESYSQVDNVGLSHLIQKLLLLFFLLTYSV